MARKHAERMAFRRKWKVLNFAAKLFGIAFFVGFILIATHTSPLLTCFLALMVLVGGGLFFVSMGMLMKQKNEEWLQQYGEPLQVAASGIEERTQRSGQGISRYYYVILNSTGSNNCIYTFEGRLTKSTTMDEQYAPGTILTVYIDPDDPSFYFVKV